jgi:hypothetical protein
VNVTGLQLESAKASACPYKEDINEIIVHKTHKFIKIKSNGMKIFMQLFLPFMIVTTDHKTKVVIVCNISFVVYSHFRDFLNSSFLH